MGTLFVVSTPIGNLEDIALRTIRVLFEVDYLACEDTRKTGLLLQRLAVGLPSTLIHWSIRVGEKKPKLISYYEGNEEKRIPYLISLLNEGKNIALVTNAGTPLISDPGFKLVRACVKEGIKVVPIPGPSAVLAALVSSGLPTDKFLFLGYLPKKPGKRAKLLKNLIIIYQYMIITVVIHVTPHRLLKELEAIKDVFGDLEIVLCRELTKLHEEISREKISQAISHFEKIKPKGEFVLVFNPTAEIRGYRALPSP